jgi:hypothetical protein
MDGGIKGGWSTRGTAKISGGDAHRREGGIEMDEGHISTRVGLVGEMRLVVHDRGVATADPHIRIEVKGLVKRSGDADGCGWLGELVGCLGEKMVL